MKVRVESVKALRLMGYTGQFLLWLGAGLWAMILVSYPRMAGEEWAFGFLQYLPLSIRWVLALIAVFGTAITSGPRWRASWIRHTSYFFSGPALKGVIALCALIGFWFFRERTIWGDGLQLVAILEGRDLPWNGPYFWREPLHYLLSRGVYLLLGLFGIHNGLTTMALISCVAGASAVWIILSLIESLTSDRLGRLILEGLVFSVGAVQLFFGHVEHYTVVLFWSLAGLLALVCSEQHPRLIWLAIGFFIFGVFSHPLIICILALPLAYVLLTQPYLRLHPTRWLGVIILSAFLSIVLYLFARFVGAPDFPILELLSGSFVGDSEVLLPLAAIFRLSHLRHLFNTFTVILPIIWLALFLIGILRLASRSRPRRPEIILWLSVVGAGAFSVAFSPKIPPPIDWDILAPFAFPAMLALGASWLASASHPYAYRWGAALAILQLTWTIPWVGINHNVIRVWPDALARHRNQPYQIADLINLLPDAQVEVPKQSLCPENDLSRPECHAVTETYFAIQQGQLYDVRPVLFAHPPSTISYDIIIPRTPSFIWLCPALDPLAWDWPGDGVGFEVQIRAQDDTAAVLLYSMEVDKSEANRRWHQVFVDLSAYAGQRVKLSLITTPRGDPAGDRAGWGIAWIVSGRAEQSYQDLWSVYGVSNTP